MQKSWLCEEIEPGIDDCDMLVLGDLCSPCKFVCKCRPDVDDCEHWCTSLL